jgi:hypothetical protein
MHLLVLLTVTSLIRLKPLMPDFAAHIEAPTPNIIMRHQTSERTLTSAWASTPALTDDRD